MSLTVASLVTNFDTYIGDSSTDRISQAERFQFLTEAMTWLQEELGNDHMVKTYTLPYFDNLHYYKTTSAIASLLEGADLRRAEDDQTESMAHKSSRELAEEIGQKSSESAWAIERKDGNSFLVVNHQSKYPVMSISGMESTTADGGAWAVDAVNSDATNLTVDNVEFKQGSGCLNFDITVAQSGNNRATIQNTTLDEMDLSDSEDLTSWIFWVYIPDVTNFTSVTFYWGSSSTSYWSATATTDAFGAAFANGWNRVKIDWSAATATSSPDSSAIDFMRFDFNYGSGQADDTDFRIDDLTLVRPENLTFSYTSWYVGTDTTGATPRTAFTATTDIPFFSGQYDQYKFAVAHMAASYAFYGPLQNDVRGSAQEVEAIKALNRVRKLIPKSVTKEEKSFKVRGLSFVRRSRRR